MQAHATLAISKRMKVSLGCFDPSGPLVGDFDSRRQSARQTGRRGFFPVWQTPETGQSADVGLGEACLLQGMPNRVFRGGLESRPIVAPVVQVGPAADH